MFERFAQDARKKVKRAAHLAELEGAAMVEVEHLLSALIDPADDEIGRRLIAAGVTPDRLRVARDNEFQSALAIAGVFTDRPAPAGARRLRRGRSSDFSPSAKLALTRTLEVTLDRGERRITTASLLAAILNAKVGSIPRLLTELDTTAAELRRRVLP
jgi:ATP-dependent Clp protease ATP-binding subunit ClpA